MTNTIMTRIGALRLAAEMALDGEDTRCLAEEQTAYSDDIEAVTRLVWDGGMDVDEAVEAVLAD